ncbi:MAG: replication-associated recombination protein A [Calditrichaeota bacterium]|nr:MAG: replication-associated recombination protein A [Calditrichota bacterium]
MELFDQQAKEITKKSTPLADRIRPQSLSEFVGQQHLLAKDKILRKAIENDDLVSMIFWGPPGVGKTTLARIIARETHSDFYTLSAVTAGVSDLRKVIEKARMNRKLGKRTILFIDEIHRFNKAQQDALLHSVEDGTLLLIGATTENPSFEVIAPLLSRCRVYQLMPLGENEIEKIIDRALQKDEILQKEKLHFQSAAKKLLVTLAGGDARIALNALELATKLASKNKKGEKLITEKLVQEVYQKSALVYDKKGDYHYDTISAFIKSVRGSDPNAALYWLARMIEAGEDPKFIARRLIILAAEDIGNADPQALVVATSAFTAVNYIGMPEGRIVLAQATTYLASAPKSNASYVAIEEAIKDARQRPMESVPLHLRNAPTPLMKQFNYADGYLYPHHFEDNFVEQNYLPEELQDRVYYRPTKNGFEKKIRERLKKLWEKYRKIF